MTTPRRGQAGPKRRHAASRNRIAKLGSAYPPSQSKAEITVDELLNVEKLIAGGAGFGRRANGEPVFVRGGLPGDELQLQRLAPERGYSRATAWSLSRPADQRRAPPCEYADQCGGCDLMALIPSAQRRSKHALVVEILRRTAHLDVSAEAAVPLAWDESPHADLGYRSRIRLHIDAQGQLGFLAEQSHEHVRVERCVVASAEVNRVLGVLHRVAERNPALMAVFSQVEIRALGESADLAWLPRQEDEPRQRARNPPPAPRRALLDAFSQLRTLLASDSDTPTLLMTLLPLGAGAAAAVELRSNAQRVPLDATGDGPALLLAPGVFSQVNWKVNQRIVRHLVDRAHRHQLRRFADLFCGAGNFSLPLLAAGLDGRGVEANPTAIELLRIASSRQNLGGSFSAESVANATQRWVQEGKKFDLIVIDPPRAGFKDALSSVAELAQHSIFLCACDPVTFARDLRSLIDRGFQLVELIAFDMFPQTHHVELVAWLRKSPSANTP